MVAGEVWSARASRLAASRRSVETQVGPESALAAVVGLQRRAGNRAVTALLAEAQRSNMPQPHLAVQRLMLRAERNRGQVPLEGIVEIRREDPDGATPELDYYDDSRSYKEHNKIYLVGHGTPGRFDRNDAEMVGDRLTRPDRGIEKESPVRLTVFSCQTGKELAPGDGANFASELNNALHDRGYRKVETSAPKGDIIVVGGRWFVVDEATSEQTAATDALVKAYGETKSTLKRAEIMRRLLELLKEYARGRPGAFFAAASLEALKKEGAFVRLLSAVRIKGVLEEVRAKPPAGLPDYFK